MRERAFDVIKISRRRAVHFWRATQSAKSSPRLVAMLVLQALPYPSRVALCAACSLCVAAWTRCAHRSLPPGVPRLLALSPCALLLLLLGPLLFSHTHDLITLLLCLASLSWWGTTKLWLIALGRAPLHRQLPLHVYAAELLLPVVAAHNSAPSLSAPRLALLFACKLALLAAVCALLSSPLAQRVAARDALFSLGMYAFLSGIMDGPGCALAGAFGMRLAPHFDAPFKSASLAEFWGRRWNVTAAALLRRSVFCVVAEGALIGDDRDGPAEKGPRKTNRHVSWGRKAAAVCATFLASGAAHEAIFWAANGLLVRPSFEWFLFFTIQGPLVCVEAVVRSKLRLRGMVAVPVTCALLLAMGSWLFFPPAVRTGLDRRVVDAIKEAWPRDA